MELQEGLNKARLATGEGSAFDTLSVDGQFGPRTLSRVLDCQRCHALSPDGVVSPRSRAALEAVLVTVPGLHVQHPFGGGGAKGG